MTIIFILLDTNYLLENLQIYEKDVIMKRLTSILLIFFCFSFTSCTDPDLFPPVLTKWKALEYDIEFSVDEQGNQIGRMFIDNKEISFFIICTQNFTMRLFPVEYYYYEDVGSDTFPPFEKWSYRVEKNKRIAIVEETTYFHIGEEITFELQGSIDSADINYPEKPDSMPEKPDYDFPYPEE